MNKKHILFVFICLLMFSFVAVKVESAESPLLLRGSADYLHQEVKAFREVKIGEEFSVTFDFFPVGSDLDVDHIEVSVYGNAFNFSRGSNSWTLSPGTSNTWESSWINIRMLNTVTYTKTVYLTAKEEGTVYAFIEGAYYDESEERHSFHAHVDVAGVHDKTYHDYQELEIDYNSLNYSYMDLQRDYNSLENDLNSTKTLMFIFMITAVVFIVTTIFSAVKISTLKRTKVKP